MGKMAGDLILDQIEIAAVAVREAGLGGISRTLEYKSSKPISSMRTTSSLQEALP